MTVPRQVAHPIAPARASVTPLAHLTLAALTSAVLLGVVLVAPNPLWAGHPSGPPPPGTPPAAPIGPAGLLLVTAFVIGVCVPFRPYRLALRTLRAAPGVSTAAVLGLTALLAAVALLIYPAYGSDVFDYLGFERMWVVYGDNPLVALPTRHPGDWATRFVWYADRTPAYGPLWAIVTWPLARLAGDGPMAAVLAYKALAGACYVACGALLWYAAPRGRRLGAFLAFAWNPLVLVEVLGKVHNDVLIAVACLGATVLATHASRRRRWTAMLALAAGALVKVSAALAAPPLALGVWRRRGGPRALGVGLVLGVALAVLLYLPFWAGPSTLGSVGNQTSRLVWSPAALLALGLSALVGPAGGRVDVAARAVLAVAWLVVLWRLGAAESLATRPGLATATAWSLTCGTLLLTGAVYAHYLVPVVALAALSESPRLDRFVLWLSIGSLAAYGVEMLSSVFGGAWLGSPAASLLGSLVLVVPPAVAVAVGVGVGMGPVGRRDQG